MLAAWEIALGARHDLARVGDVEEDEGEEHEGGVEDVLEGFVEGDAAFVALGVFDEAEYDANLMGRVSITFGI